MVEVMIRSRRTNATLTRKKRNIGEYIVLYESKINFFWLPRGFSVNCWEQNDLSELDVEHIVREQSLPTSWSFLFYPRYT